MLAKDFHKLMKSICSFSNNQAVVSDYDDNLETLKVQIIPRSGFYHGGKFDFEIAPKNYPKEAPSVKCVTVIYHPNIDSDNGDICLNLFSEWSETNNLEDCVQGLLFLLYNPNLEDPLSPLFDPEEDSNPELFAERVRISLEGGDVDGTTFERNLVSEAVHTDEDSVGCNCEAQNSQKTTLSTSEPTVTNENYTSDLAVVSSVTTSSKETSVSSNMNSMEARSGQNNFYYFCLSPNYFYGVLHLFFCVVELFFLCVTIIFFLLLNYLFV